MRKVLVAATSFFLVCISVAQSPASAPKPSAFSLQDGTPLKLRLTRTLSSADTQVDDRVDFEVLEEVKVGDTVVVPKGGIAWGTVTEAQPKRRMGRGGKLNVNIDSVRLADGEKAALRAVKEVKGGGHTGAMTGGMVATGIVFFPAAPFFLFMHGKDITIPKGTEITAYVNGDMPLELAKFQASSQPQAVPIAATQAPAPGPAPVASSSPATAKVAFTSVPDGADVEVDGAYVGSTPSTLDLPVGDHAVVVKKAGYAQWERKIHVFGGSDVKLNAELEKTQ